MNEADLSYRLIDVKKGRFGKKVTAARKIRAGETIVRFGGKPMSFNDTLSASDESFALQVGADEYIFLDEPSRFFNHSCEPNCGLTPALHLVALSEIEAGTELRWDYSTSMLERHWTMPCECGAPSCRNLVADFDTLPRELQQHYASVNVVQSFIRERLGL